MWPSSSLAVAVHTSSDEGPVSTPEYWWGTDCGLETVNACEPKASLPLARLISRRTRFETVEQ